MIKINCADGLHAYSSIMSSLSSILSWHGECVSSSKKKKLQQQKPYFFCVCSALLNIVLHICMKPTNNRSFASHKIVT